MIVDDVIITIHAGDGGDGKVSFRREKFVPKGGPDGGCGGKGGDIYARGVSDLTALYFFRGKKEIKGTSGKPGEGRKKTGKNGEDTYIRIPVGTQIIDLHAKKLIGEILHEDQCMLLARGGFGGRGNFEFRSNENKTPRKAETGRPGEKKELRFNLLFIADIGLIGLPNAGKSSLLNALTSSHAKIGSYPFTTLEPNLGTLEHLVIADIPGLIEGAHTGKGLGIKFLKHIEKTRLLVHLIDATESDVEKSYNTIWNELTSYNPCLREKKEVIVLTKTDLETQEKLNVKKQLLHKITQKEVFDCCIFKPDTLLSIRSHLLSTLNTCS